MTLERTIAQLFRMDDATWLRHANPWSGILRLTALPAPYYRILEPSLARVVGSHPGCYCTPVDMVQPQHLPAPQSLDHWMSKGAMGERVWLNRDAVPVPQYHRKVPKCSFSSCRYRFGLYHLGCFHV